jgi:hypothetical protein
MDSEKITLLNGEVWDKADLVARAKDDEFYYRYLGANTLGSTSCGMLAQSPKTYYYNRKYGKVDTTAMAIGRIVHLLVLEPERIAKEFHIWDDDELMQEIGGANPRATKRYKEAKIEFDKDKGRRLVLNASELRESERIANAVLRNEMAMSLLEGTETEYPMVEMLDGYPFRAKADAIDLKQNLIIDLKTTNDLSGFKYGALKRKYALQAHLYTRVFGVPPTNFVFIVVDKGSLDVGIFTIKESFWEKGGEQLRLAIDAYRRYFIDGEEIDSYTIIGELE